jgi:hypothetical protein
LLRIAFEDAEYIPEFAAHVATYPDHTYPWQSALVAIHDPAKLAELMANALRVRGLVDGNHVRITHYMHPIKNQTIGIWWPRRCKNADCDMAEARAKLLAIMQTAPDKSSRKACESILRGNQ